MSLPIENYHFTRRELLRRSGMGLGLLGLASVLGDSGLSPAAELAGARLNPLTPKAPHGSDRTWREF